MPELRTHVIWDGWDLSDDFEITDVERPFPVRSTSTGSVPGRDGGYIEQSQFEPLEITMTLTVVGRGRVRRRETMRRLMQALDVEEPRRLQFTDDLGRYYEAMPSGGGERTGHFNAEGVTVTFTAPSPAMYGERRSVTVPSGGSVAFEVGGNYRTHPEIYAAAAVRGTSDLWGLRIDGGDYLRVRLATSAPRAVRIDSEAREAYIAGALALPTLDSDWFALTPGQHTLQMDVGTGAAVVEWDERWL